MPQYVRPYSPWQNLPTKTTPIAAAVLTSIDDALINSVNRTPSVSSENTITAGVGINVLAVRRTGDTFDRASVASDGTINFGPGTGATQVALSWSATDTIKVDKNLNVLLQLQLGSDWSISRSATNTAALAAGDSLSIPSGSLLLGGELRATFNTQTVPASGQGFSLSWNKSAGQGEVNFWNVYNSYSAASAGPAFEWWRLASDAPTGVKLLTVGNDGSLTVKNNLTLQPNIPVINTGGSYITIPNGIYVSGGEALYSEVGIKARAGIQQDVGTSPLTLQGGSAGTAGEGVVTVDNNAIAGISSRKGIVRVYGPSPWYDITAWGAVPGVDTVGQGDINRVAIQGAIDACSTAGGGTVFIPRGVFYLTQNGTTGYALALKSNVTVEGTGRAISNHTYFSVLHAQASSTAFDIFRVTSSPVIDVNLRSFAIDFGREGISIPAGFSAPNMWIMENLGFNYQGNAGFRCYDEMERMLFRECLFVGSQWGVKVDYTDASNEGFLDKTRFEHCHFYAIQQYAMEIDCWVTRTMTIDHCSVHGMQATNGAKGALSLRGQLVGVVVTGLYSEGCGTRSGSWPDVLLGSANAGAAGGAKGPQSVTFIGCQLADGPSSNPYSWSIPEYLGITNLNGDIPVLNRPVLLIQCQTVRAGVPINDPYSQIGRIGGLT